MRARQPPGSSAASRRAGWHLPGFAVAARNRVRRRTGRRDADRVSESSALLVDAGGMPFGSGAFDVGSRVLSPALWARGLRRLDTLLLTHGDPDHIGGAPAMVDDFAPSAVWEGIPVPRHRGLQALLAQAREAGARVERRLAGDAFHDRRRPRSACCTRRRPTGSASACATTTRWCWRCDMATSPSLLLGDVGAAIERAILPQLTPARMRILKVAHHGSRTSTSQELVEDGGLRLRSSAAAAATRSATLHRRSSDASSRSALRSTGPTWTGKSRSTQTVKQVRVKTYVRRECEI